MTTHKIPFGLLNGRMVSASDVPRGLACGCICAECNGQLVAKHPTKNIVKHFSHYNNDTCIGGYETSLHKAAKQVLLDNKAILLPELSSEAYLFDPESRIRVDKKKTISQRMISLDYVAEESREYKGIIPDIVATIGDKLLFIEIAVTHFVDQDKLEKLESLGHASMEIDLSSSSRTPTMQEIERLVIHSATNRHWVVNTKQKALDEFVLGQAKAELERGITDFKAEKARLQEKRFRYKNLSNEDKFTEDLTAMRVRPERLNTIIGHKVKCDYSILAPTKTWQLSLFRQFIYKQGGFVMLDASDIYDWMSDNFNFKVSENFKDAPKVAIYYYLQKLIELKFVEKGYGRGIYEVYGNKSVPY